MDNLISEFNSTSYMCVEFIISVTNDSDLRFYKKLMDNILIAEKNKIVEQFIIYCLPHEKHETKYRLIKTSWINGKPF